MLGQPVDSRTSEISKRTKSGRTVTDPHIVEFFDSYKDSDNAIAVTSVLHGIEQFGLYPTTDPRLEEVMEYLSEKADKLEFDELDTCFRISDGLLLQAARNELAIPRFQDFKRNIDMIYRSCQLEMNGEVSSETPYFLKQNPDLWGLSVCSVSGQIINLGDTKSKFILHRCSRPIIFAMGLELLGLDKVLSVIGMDYSFIEGIEVLNKNGVPANLMHEAGGITLSSWIRNVGLQGKTDAEIYDYIEQFFKKITGGKYVKFCNTAFMSEKDAARKNKAIVFYLKSNGCLPKNSDPEKDFDFYLTAGSYEVDCESLARIGQILASLGENCYTHQTILPAQICQLTCSMMTVCAPHKRWPFQKTLPATSAASGCLLVIFPGVMAMSLFSPKVDKNGCSIRALHFFEGLEQAYFFHRFDDQPDLLCSEQGDIKVQTECPNHCWIYSAATKKNMFDAMNIISSQAPVCRTNYFGRNVLHEAAAAGNLESVKLLISACPRLLDTKDVVGYTPMDDALHFGHSEVVKYFEKWYVVQTGIPYQKDCIDKKNNKADV